MNIYWKFGSYLILAMVMLATGWNLQKWKSDKVIAEIRLKQEKERSGIAETALQDLAKAASNVKQAAEEQSTNQRVTNEKLIAISSQIKKIKLVNPLPVDCKPDDDRLRNFKTAIDAANSAAARR